MRQSKQRKICLITPEFLPQNRGGLARTAHRVAGIAADLGMEVHVAHLVIRDGPPPLLDRNRDTRREQGLIIHRIEVGAEPSDPTLRQRWDCGHTLTLRMMHESLDLLHQEVGFSLFHALFLFPIGYVTGMLARRSKTPCITTLVGDDFNRFVFSPSKVGALTSALQSADRVVTLSRQMAQAVAAFTPLKHEVRVIHNSVAEAACGWSPPPLTGRPLRVGCAGFFKYSKGLPYLLAAVAHLRAEMPVELELLGGFKRGQRQQFDYWVKEFQMAEAVRIVQPGDQQKVMDWLCGLDAFALPSLSEGCPNILMEAMACGLPCVATRVGACPELIEHGVSGLLTPWGDSLALAQALARILESPRAASAMGAKAREAMRRRFSPQSERRAWAALYAELLDS